MTPKAGGSIDSGRGRHALPPFDAPTVTAPPYYWRPRRASVLLNGAAADGRAVTRRSRTRGGVRARSCDKDGVCGATIVSDGQRHRVRYRRGVGGLAQRRVAWAQRMSQTGGGRE